MFLFYIFNTVVCTESNYKLTEMKSNLKERILGVLSLVDDQKYFDLLMPATMCFRIAADAFENIVTTLFLSSPFKQNSLYNTKDMRYFG